MFKTTQWTSSPLCDPPSIYISIYLSFYSSIYPSIYLSIYISIHLFIYPSIYLEDVSALDKIDMYEDDSAQESARKEAEAIENLVKLFNGLKFYLGREVR